MQKNKDIIEIIKKCIPAIFLAGIFFSCSNDLDKVKKVMVQNEGPDEITTEVTMYFTDMGKSKLKLESPLVYRYFQNQHTQLECPDGMVVTFYDSLQEIESTLSAHYGLLRSEEQYLQVKDSVIFTNNQNDRLDTEILHLYFGKDSIYTDAFVKIQTTDGLISGKGLVSNSNFTKYELLSITNSYYLAPQDSTSNE